MLHWTKVKEMKDPVFEREGGANLGRGVTGGAGKKQFVRSGIDLGLLLHHMPNDRWIYFD